MKSNILKKIWKIAVRSYLTISSLVWAPIYLYLKIFKSKEIKKKFAKSENIIKEKRDKDTVFIFGSGASIKQISKKEWSLIRKKGVTFAFNQFFRVNHVDIDYNLFKDISSYSTIFSPKSIRKTKEYIETMKHNKRYKNTTHFLWFSKSIIKPLYLSFRGPAYAYFIAGLFNDIKNQVCFFSNSSMKNNNKIGESIREIGHPRNSSSLFFLINIAYLMGFKKIVLVGVDLYDWQYSWENKKSNKKRKTYPHSGHIQCVKTMKRWKPILEKKGIKVYVHNPKSLLSKVIPVYNIHKN